MMLATAASAGKRRCARIWPSYTFFCAFLSMLAAALPALACPSAIVGQEFSPPLIGVRSGLRLFAKNPAVSAAGWRDLPVQIDPLNNDGILQFPAEPSWRAQQLTANDYITFDQEGFGAPLDPQKDRLPCQGPLVFELSDPTRKRFAYMTVCSTPTPKFADIVAFRKAEHLLESAAYRYRFNHDNYMQFDQIAFKNSAGGWDEVAKDSRLLIHADVRRFFAMDFDSRQIESTLEAFRLGPVADVARLSFFLRVLFFKIDLKLATDVGFFGSTGHIPMVVNLPVDAAAWLHPKSGILYSWEPAAALRHAAASVRMPVLDVPAIGKGVKSLAPLGLKYCKGSECFFSYAVKLGSRVMSMDLTVKRALVAQGFFPIFVDDLSSFRDKMGWTFPIEKGSRRVGMYFEVSGLPEGGHPWDFWLRLGAPGTLEDTCPTPVNLRRLDT